MNIKGDNLLWDTPPSAAETALDILLKSRLQKPYKSHVMVVTFLITFSCRNQMGEEAGFLFTVPVGVPCWGLLEHEPLIIDLSLPIVPRSTWKVPWTIHGSDWGIVLVRYF